MLAIVASLCTIVSNVELCQRCECRAEIDKTGIEVVRLVRQYILLLIEVEDLMKERM